MIVMIILTVEMWEVDNVKEDMCIVQLHSCLVPIQVIPKDNSDHLSLPAPVVQGSDLGFACLLAVSARLLCGQFSGYFILGLGTLHVHSS